MNPRDALADQATRSCARIASCGAACRMGRGSPTGDDGRRSGARRGVHGHQREHQVSVLNFCSRSGCTTASSRGSRARDVDPFAGEPRADSRFRIPTPNSGPKNLFDMPRFITLRGGGYFFIPSVTALHYIADQGLRGALGSRVERCPTTRRAAVRDVRNGSRQAGDEPAACAQKATPPPAPAASGCRRRSRTAAGTRSQEEDRRHLGSG